MQFLKLKPVHFLLSFLKHFGVKHSNTRCEDGYLNIHCVQNTLL